MKRTALPCACLVVLAVAFSWHAWSGPINWTPDGLFYQAQSLEVTGSSPAAARHAVFDTPAARVVMRSSGTVRGSTWIAYAAPFYRRRWVAPIAAAALRPAFHARSLLIVSLLGYLLCGIGAFFLLRRRFGNGVALFAAAGVLWFPPLRMWAQHPLTDSLGVALLCACLLAGARAQSGSRGRLFVWVAAVCLLAFTRDTAAIPAFAAVAFAAAERTRRSLGVAAAGALAAAPAPLLLGAPLRKTMAFTFSGNSIPATSNWSFVFHHYVTYVYSMLAFDFPVQECLPIVTVLLGVLLLLAVPGLGGTDRLRKHVVAWVLVAVAADVAFYNHLQIYGQELTSGVLLLVCLVPLFMPGRRDDTLLRFARAGTIGATAYLFVLPEFSAGRLELVLVPFAAVGVARAATWWTQLSPAPAAVPKLSARATA